MKLLEKFMKQTSKEKTYKVYMPVREGHDFVGDYTEQGLIELAQSNWQDLKNDWGQTYMDSIGWSKKPTDLKSALEVVNNLYEVQ